MALAATVQWDVRTGGSDTNGGGFDTGVASPGTDFSQQNSAQVAFTDLVIGSTNTQLTSAGNPFSSASVGNVINITGGTGFTTGRYEVMSVSVSTATMDRAVGTASSTGGTGNLGGSLATILTGMNAAYSANTVWVKSGTYTVTTSGLVNNSLVSANGWMYVTGYGSTHGDNGTKPLLTTATNSVDLLRIDLSQTGALIVFQNLSLSNTASTRGNGIQQYNGGAGYYIEVNSCTFDGFANAINGDNVGSHGFFSGWSIDNSLIKNCTSSTSAAITISTGGTIYACTITGGASDAYRFLGTGISTTIIGSLIYGNTGFAVNTISGTPTNQIVLIGNTIANNTAGGINLYQSTPSSSTIIMVRAVNNIFYGNGTYGFALSVTSAIGINANNAYGANTSGARNNLAAGTNDVTLTANPFVNSSGGNFALNNTTGGGPLCKQAGFPGAFPGGLSTGHPDIGAVQTSGGSSNPVPTAANLAGGVTGTAYSETISASGGTSPYTYAVTSGALPTSTSLNTSTGVISGTPTVAGTYSFTITVTDNLSATGSTAFQIIISSPVATGGLLVNPGMDGGIRG